MAGVSASFFAFFDAPPAAGRYFSPAEDATPSGTPAVALSHAYWRSMYGGAHAIGESIRIDTVAVTGTQSAPESRSHAATRPPEARAGGV